MKKIALHWQVIIGLVLGTAYAWFAVNAPASYNLPEITTDFIKPLGDIFINLLKLIAVPLVLFSVISGIISLQDVKKLGRMGLKTLGMYLATTMFAVCLGLLVVNIAKPGENVSEELRTERRISYELWLNENPDVQRLDDVCLSCDPANAELVAKVQAASGEQPNEWVDDKLGKYEKETKKGPLQPLVDVVPSNIFGALSASSMLQIIFFAIFFGIALAVLPEERTKVLKTLIENLNEVFIKMVWMIMSAMPIFVFALMAGQIVGAAGSDPEKFNQLLGFLLQYSLAVVIGLLLMAYLIYPLLAMAIAKMGYGKFIGGIRDAQITAFSTSSSVATLPVTMDCLHKNLKVSKTTTSFVLPIGATVNMDGTSLYQAVAVVALAQFHGVDLSIAQQAVIVITATLASIGAAAVPSAGLVLMIMVLTSVGLNPAWIALIFPVDRILDMCRTVVNVTGDATVATVVAKTEGQLDTALDAPLND